MTVVLELLDHVVLGIAAGLLCWRLSLLAADSSARAGAGTSTTAVAAIVRVLALIVALAVLVLLLGRSSSQDGLLLGDVRLRNLSGAAGLVMTFATGLAWSRIGALRRASPAARDRSARSGPRG